MWSSTCMSDASEDISKRSPLVKVDGLMEKKRNFENTKEDLAKYMKMVDQTQVSKCQSN